MSTVAPNQTKQGRLFDSLPPASIIFGESDLMLRVQQRVERVAQSNCPILIQGETGTGKEVLASFIHRISRWGAGSFVKVSCPAIPGTLLESELFGYEAGAFTGAYGTRLGLVEGAHRGTLFLDEICELDRGLQAKLLQVIEDGRFSRLGGQEDQRADLRVICTTNHNLDRDLHAGTLREDLFYRINVVTIHLPPLRERRADIPALVQYLVDFHGQRYQRHSLPLSGDLMAMIEKYDWPGNIRQLENLILQYVVLGSEEAIRLEVSGADQNRCTPRSLPQHTVPLKEITRQATRELERRVILKALETSGWNRRQAAQALNISYRALLYKIRQNSLSAEGSPQGGQSGIGRVM